MLDVFFLSIGINRLEVRERTEDNVSMKALFETTQQKLRYHRLSYPNNFTIYLFIIGTKKFIGT